MSTNDEYDADEVLREGEVFDDAHEAVDEIDELDFDSRKRKSYGDIVGEMGEPSDSLD